MRKVIIAGALLGLALGASMRSKAQGPAKDASSGDSEEGKTFAFDNGPDTIDTSAYPAALQKNYLVFAMKCSKCHTLARPINAPFALPEEWQAYVGCMQHKKRSGVDAESAKKIIEFLTYDSTVRKKDLIAQKEQLKKDGKYVMTFEGSTCQPPASQDAKPAAASKGDSAPKTTP